MNDITDSNKRQSEFYRKHQDEPNVATNDDPPDLIERLKFFDDWADLKAAGDLMDEAATALSDADKTIKTHEQLAIDIHARDERIAELEAENNRLDCDICQSADALRDADEQHGKDTREKSRLADKIVQRDERIAELKVDLEGAISMRRVADKDRDALYATLVAAPEPAEALQGFGASDREEPAAADRAYAEWFNGPRARTLSDEGEKT